MALTRRIYIRNNGEEQAHEATRDTVTNRVQDARLGFYLAANVVRALEAERHLASKEPH